METGPITHQIIKEASSIQERFKINDFQALQIATEIVKVLSFRDAFGVYNSDDDPKFLEKIGMELESLARHFDCISSELPELTQSFEGMKFNLEEIKTSIENHC
ncbi:MAG: hypothetical protein WCO63_15225 [Bacteroidota bacterium]